MKNNNNSDSLNIYINLIIVIFFLIFLQGKNINANNITLDTNKLITKSEIQNLIDTLYAETNNIDSVLKANNILDSLDLLQNNSRGLNLEDSQTEIEFFTDSSGHKQLKIIVTGVLSDFLLSGVKKIEIKINDNKQFKNNLETPKEKIKNEFNEDIKFDFEKMSDEEIKNYLKAHHKENLNEEQIEISRENGNIIIIIKKEKSKEN